MSLGTKNPHHTYYLYGEPLEETVCEKDVGVWISSTLKPSAMVAATVKKANRVLGMLSRGTGWRDTHTWVKLYTVYCRPMLEYCGAAWAPWSVSDTDLLESVQRRAVKMVSTLNRSMTYEEKLVACGLTTLVARRERGAAIEMYRVMTGVSRVSHTHFWDLSRGDDGEVRGHTTRSRTGHLNIEIKTGKTQQRREFWSVKNIPAWNRLSDWTKMAPSVLSFKSRYDDEMKRIVNM